MKSELRSVRVAQNLVVLFKILLRRCLLVGSVQIYIIVSQIFHVNSCQTDCLEVSQVCKRADYHVRFASVVEVMRDKLVGRNLEHAPVEGLVARCQQLQLRRLQTSKEVLQQERMNKDRLKNSFLGFVKAFDESDVALKRLIEVLVFLKLLLVL